MPGTVTLLFTDLVGSTELLARLGEEEMQAVRRGHFALLQQAAAAHGGEVVKSLGDGIMAAFASASDGAGCAVAIQRAVAREARRARGDIHTLAVRIGLSAGEPIREDGDYHGTPVVEAARLCAAARGGQILASEVVRLLVGARAARDFASIGSLELKGLPDPVVASEIAWAEEADDSAPLPLPAQLSTRGQLAFAGRDEERARLVAHWQVAAAGERRIVLIAGEPGIGKTRLASELAATAHTAGAIVLAGRCDEELAVPYAPFAEALRPWVNAAPADLLAAHVEHYGGDLARLVPELGRRIPDLPEPRRGDPETERWCLFEAAVSLVTTASTVAPVLLVLDDLHWAGKPALLLLRHLVRSPDPAALLVVVTYRDTDLGRTHPLTEVMADLRRAAGVERVALRGLGAAGVCAMLEAAAGTALDEPGRALAAAIARETEGNPFFVQEILRHLVETGTLRRGADGQWTSDSSVDQLAIPEGIREVVGRRLSRLSETANRVLAAAAVVGREVDVGVLEALGEAPSEAVLDALDEARRARLLVEDDARPGRFAFSHAVVRQTLLEELGTTRRVRLHLKIGEAIEQLAGQRVEEHLRTLAHHFGEAAIAGGAARAVKYSRMAGDQAIAGAAWEEAASYYERALGALELDGALAEHAQEELRCDLLVALADAKSVHLKRDTVRSTARRAYDIARRLRDPVRLARAARAYGVEDFSFGVGDTTLLAMLDEALDGLGPDEHSLRAGLLNRKVMYLDSSGSGTDTRPIASEALAVATHGGNSNAIRLAHVARCRSLGGTADLAGYVEAANGVASLSGTIGVGFFGSAAFSLAQAAVRRGDSAEFSRHRQLYRDLAEKFRLSAGRALVAQWDAAEALWRGRFEDARRLTRSLEDLVPGDPSFRVAARDQRAVARIETGRGRELIAAHEALVTAFPSFAYTRALLAMLRAESGDVDGAREAFEVLASDGFAGLPHGFSRPGTLHRLAETCALLGDAERAAPLYDILLPYSGQLLISFLLQACLGAADRDLGLLAATMGRLGDAERHLVAAEALEERLGAPPLVARSRLALAHVLLRRGASGDHDRARERLDQVVDAAAAMGMAGVEHDARALVADVDTRALRPRADAP